MQLKDLRELAARKMCECSVGGNRPANPMALLLALDASSLGCSPADFITQPAVNTLAQRAFDKVAMLAALGRRSAIAASPNLRNQQLACEPWYRFWQIVNEAAVSAQSLPIKESDIEQAMAVVNQMR
ncbi:MAG: hypothetical protein K2W82_16830 [Candidatus Obscuribacterales bacterium]|nr:hypothetical protein [Candidatus Obscuribacterales bacterium]